LNEKVENQSSNADLKEVHPTTIVISKDLSLRSKSVKKTINLVERKNNGVNQQKSAIFKGSPRVRSKSPSSAKMVHQILKATSQKN
jgi:hypothetical protein